jgi:hypothetical protein
MKHAVLSLVAAVAVAAASADARVKVKTDHDPTADFTRLKTWAWLPDGPGQFKMALTKDDDPEALRKQFEPTLLASVEQNLAQRGFTKAAQGQEPDFLVAYFALVSTNMSAQTIGQFLPGTLEWGIPPFQGQTQSLKIYEQGSLVLDVMTPTRQPMWRGLAQAELHRDRTLAERERRLREAVRDLLRQFPPKKR